MLIRQETSADTEGIRRVHLAAFETDAEARLVDALRERCAPLISLVADDGGEIVGHIIFSPVTLAGRNDLRLMGLAPMAVAPSRQRLGVGSSLVVEGLAHCRQAGIDAVVVLGHPTYYPRFGFVPAARRSLTSEYEVPADVFMVCELRSHVLDDVSGTVRYHQIFQEFS